MADVEEAIADIEVVGATSARASSGRSSRTRVGPVGSHGCGNKAAAGMASCCADQINGSRPFKAIINGKGTRKWQVVISVEKVVISVVVPNVQPPMDAMEYTECEATIKDFLLFREAMRKRGIEEMDLVMVDVGYYGEEDAPSCRLA